MKNLGRIKLNQLSKVELEEREMKTLVGGCQAHCCCRNMQDYPYNAGANQKDGLHVANGGYSERYFDEYGNSTTPYDVVVWG